MHRGVILVIVHAHDDGEVLAFGRRGDDDLLSAAPGDVVLGALHYLALLVDAVLLDGEQAGGFHDDVHAQIAPGDLARIGFLEGLDFLAVNHQRAIHNLNRAVEAAIVAVVLQQVRHRLQVADVVERDDFQGLRMVIANGLENLAANAAETVNTDTNCHVSILLRMVASSYNSQGGP